jgi:hypothetical protein
MMKGVHCRKQLFFESDKVDKKPEIGKEKVKEHAEDTKNRPGPSA